jgi:replicative DNA helicase
VKWKKRTIDTEAEKEIITGMIVNDRFLQEVRQVYESNLLQLPFSRLVGKWCTQYFGQYEKAPGETIQELFSDYAGSKQADQTQVELIEKFLSNLSNEYEKSNSFNVEYNLDKAEKYFKARQIEALRDNLSAALTQDKIVEAEKLIGEFRRIKRPESVGVDILKDKQAIISAFDEEEVLFQMPGALGELLHPFIRDDLIAVAAPMKRGKSFILIDIALRGLYAKLKVLFISLEMTQKQMMKRIYQSFLGETRTEKEVQIPKFIRGKVDHNIVLKKGMTIAMATKKAKALKNTISSGQFKLLCFAANSLTVEDLKTHLSNMEYYDKFVPDAIVIDYADILAPSFKTDVRHQIDHIWRTLRGIAQEKHCLVVTASQMSKATLNRDAEQGDVSEDIRKLAHVSSMVALNQTIDEKKAGIMRCSMLAQRHEEFYIDNEVVLLQCLAIGKPYLNSKWKKDVKI